jgi:hypothetical protein
METFARVQITDTTLEVKFYGYVLLLLSDTRSMHGLFAQHDSSCTLPNRLATTFNHVAEYFQNFIFI